MCQRDAPTKNRVITRCHTLEGICYSIVCRYETKYHTRREERIFDAAFCTGSRLYRGILPRRPASSLSAINSAAGTEAPLHTALGTGWYEIYLPVRNAT